MSGPRYGRKITLNGAEGVLVLETCLRCGAVVDDQRAHNMWHDQSSGLDHDSAIAFDDGPEFDPMHPPIDLLTRPDRTGMSNRSDLNT